MTTAGTYYYPPSAGTGNLLLANPPFIFQPMDINQPNPAEDLPMLTEEEFAQFSQEAGGSGMFEACNYAHAFRIAQRAYAKGADAELDACCQWLLDGNHRFTTAFHEDAANLRGDRRPKPPTLKEQALAAARIEVNPHGKNGALIMRALEALPE
jgi:hypothetical protein